MLAGCEDTAKESHFTDGFWFMPGKGLGQTICIVIPKGYAGPPQGGVFQPLLALSPVQWVSL